MTKIQWTDETWNPIRGCSAVSAGCEHCYAQRMAHRFSGPGRPYDGLTRMTAHGPKWTGEVRLVPELLGLPLRWRKPRRIFVNSMSDLFHEDVPDDYIGAAFGVMAACPQHIFQILTKRPERMREWFDRMSRLTPSDLFVQRAAINAGVDIPLHPVKGTIRCRPWPLLNVWLGVSCEDQAAADERIPLLLQTPAAVRWVSAEPLLGPVNLCAVPDDACRPAAFSARYSPLGDLDWVVVGGESGPRARPCSLTWIRSILDQCLDSGVPVFLKQLGACAFEPASGRTEGGHELRVGLKHRSGADPNEWPEDLRVREFPR